MKHRLAGVSLFALAIASEAHADGLYMRCEGKGSPTIVLEAGASRTSADWSKVMSLVTPTTRVCAYDRASLGKSPTSATGSTTALADARALAKKLDQVAETGPMVLVGHSYGGLVVRVFAREFPRRVAGVVLVDSSLEDFGQRRAKLLHESLDYPRQSPIDWPTSFEQVKQLITLGDKPLVVLTAGNIVPGEPSAAVQLWFDMQAHLARLSARGTHRVVPHSGHMIPLDAPEAVSQAILEVVRIVRADAR